MDGDHESFVAECFWPGVARADLVALDLRIEEAVAEHVPPGAIRYLGSLLLREDEVVLCRFQGSADTVEHVAVRAAVPFERILAVDHSPSIAHEQGGST
jgi:hypothetical protein